MTFLDPFSTKKVCEAVEPSASTREAEEEEEEERRRRAMEEEAAAALQLRERAERERRDREERERREREAEEVARLRLEAEKAEALRRATEEEARRRKAAERKPQKPKGVLSCLAPKQNLPDPQRSLLTALGAPPPMVQVVKTGPCDKCDGELSPEKKKNRNAKALHCPHWEVTTTPTTALFSRSPGTPRRIRWRTSAQKPTTRRNPLPKCFVRPVLPPALPQHLRSLILKAVGRLLWCHSPATAPACSIPSLMALRRFPAKAQKRHLSRN